MLLCPYCESEVKESNNFCGKCFEQVRCISCRSILEEDAPLCLVCGTAVPGSTVESAKAKQTNNRFRYRHKRTPKSSETEWEADFTDEATSGVAQVMRLIAEPEAPLTEPEFHRKPDIEEFEKRSALLPPSTDGDNKNIKREPEFVERTQISNRKADEASASSFFKPHNDDDIRPTQQLNDYLASNISAKDKQQHYMVLYVHAYHELYSIGVSKDRLAEALKEVKANAKNNYAKLFSDAIADYLIERGSVVEPHSTGYKLIEDTITPRIQNPPTHVKEDKPSPKSKRASSQPSSSEMEKLKPWLERDLKLDFDVLKLGDSPSQWVLFIYHVLINELKVASTVPSGLAHAYATQQFSTIPIDRKRFTGTAKDLRQSKKMGISQGKEYYLLDAGKEQIMKIISSA